MSQKIKKLRLNQEQKVKCMQCYAPGTIMRLLALVTIILIVPIQLFCEDIVIEKEQDMILNLQQSSFVPESC